MIYYIIALIILAYSCKEYKRGFLWFLIYKIFLVTNISMISIPGVPLLTVEVFMTLVIIALFFIKRKRVDIDNRRFPFATPFKWLAFSWLLSTIFAYIGFAGAASAFVKSITTHLITIYLMWLLIKDKSDILFLIKWFTIAFIPITIYAYYEYATQSNPIISYHMTMISDEERVVNFIYDANRGRGYRVQSMFEHSIGAGINWAMYIIMIYVMMFKYGWKSKYTNGALLLTLLSIPVIFFTNSRAPIVFLAIGSLAFINFKNKKFYTYSAILVTFVIIALPYFSDYIINILSIFDSKAQAEVGGSSAEMRFEQLAAAIALMRQSPIVGFGFKFLNVIDNTLTHALLGMESIWFLTLTQFGMLGVIANSILCYYSLIKIPRQYRSKSLFYISLAYWVTASLTSVPGMLVYMYYMILIMIIKLTTKQCHKYP